MDERNPQDSRTDMDYTDHAAEAWSHLIPGTDVSTLAITMRLRRIVKELDHILATDIDGTPLTAYGDYQVLAALRRSGSPLQPSDLAESFKVTRSGTTGRLHRLKQLGLIEKRTHPDDARRALISITPKGARLADRIFLAGQKAQASALASLTDQEQELLSNLLRKALITLKDTPTSGED